MGAAEECKNYCPWIAALCNKFDDVNEFAHLAFETDAPSSTLRASLNSHRSEDGTGSILPQASDVSVNTKRISTGAPKWNLKFNLTKSKTFNKLSRSKTG